MANIRGNPNWIKGKSGNPRGRPRGQNSLAAFYHDPDYFLIRHLRWQRFCWEYLLKGCNGAEAARRGQYSHKSARYIASRLLKNTIDIRIDSSISFSHKKEVENGSILCKMPCQKRD